MRDFDGNFVAEGAAQGGLFLARDGGGFLAAGDQFAFAGFGGPAVRDVVGGFWAQGVFLRSIATVDFGDENVFDGLFGAANGAQVFDELFVVGGINGGEGSFGRRFFGRRFRTIDGA